MGGSGGPEFDSGRIAFRQLQDSDMRLMLEWLNDPYLEQVYLGGRKTTMKEVTGKYMPRVEGKDPVSPYLILYDGKHVGHIQSCMWSDYPDFSICLKKEERNASDPDVFIGENSFRGRGFGPLMLKRFLKEVVFTRYNTDNCLVTPLMDNRIAIRAYEKAGFRKVRLLDHPDEQSALCLMAISRETAAAGGITSQQ